MKLSWRVELVQLAIMAGMFTVAAWAWPQVPDRLPVHRNLQGAVDRYGGKFEGLLLLPLVTLGLYLLLRFVSLIDPGRLNYQNFRKAYNAIRIALVLFMALMYGLMIYSAFGNQGNTTTVILLAMGALFIVLGNFMGKIRPNWFVGVRTPWTLSSKLSWDKTHRLAGWLFVLMGALFFLLHWCKPRGCSLWYSRSTRCASCGWWCTPTRCTAVIRTEPRRPRRCRETNDWFAAKWAN
jgi:uncharacterized membrane protein